jgi:uncharacterized membrane protein
MVRAPAGISRVDPRGAIPRRAVSRVAVSLACGLLAFALAASKLAFLAAVLVGWDFAGMVLLGLSWGIIAPADAKGTRKLAGAEDPGRTLVYAVVILTSGASLLAATLIVRSARGLPEAEKDALIALCLATVALAWTITHTAFTLRYAHLYYREDAEGIGGVTVPGDLPPTYFDFAYFAFTIGMCFQVSDVCVTSPQIRRTVLLHAVLSFAYNSVVLAFVLSLVFGLAA